MQYIKQYDNNQFEVYTEGDNNHFSDLPKAKQEQVLSWIEANIFPIKTPLMKRSSKGMKHILHSKTGIYLSNNQFKEAMLMCGFEPVDPSQWSWHFGISKKSPIFHIS